MRYECQHFILVPSMPAITIVDVLLELLAWQQFRIDELEQEILKLKGDRYIDIGACDA